MLGQDRLDEEVHGMALEMRRDVTDTQPAVGRAIIGVRCAGGGERVGMKLAPAAMLGQMAAGVAARVKVQRVNQVAVRPRVDRVESHGCLIFGDRFLQATKSAQGVGQVGVPQRRVGSEFDGAPRRRGGAVQPAEFRQRHGQAGKCAGRRRLLTGQGELGHGFFVTTERRQDGAQIGTNGRGFG